MSRKSSKQPPVEAYQLIDWAGLERLTDGTCACCDERFHAGMRPELTGRCHTGPVFLSYWDGNLYVECGQCRKPIVKIRVDRRLV